MIDYTHYIKDKYELVEYLRSFHKVELVKFDENLSMIRITNLSKNKLVDKITTYIINQRGYAILRSGEPYSY